VSRFDGRCRQPTSRSPCRLYHLRRLAASSASCSSTRSAIPFPTAPALGDDPHHHLSVEVERVSIYRQSVLPRNPLTARK